MSLSQTVEAIRTALADVDAQPLGAVAEAIELVRGELVDTLRGTAHGEPTQAVAAVEAALEQVAEAGEALSAAILAGQAYLRHIGA